jgi:trehalose 6-phosphate phosphatase
VISADGMRILNERFDLEHFFKQVSHASHRALLLDYDGTLAPFRVERSQAVPYPGVRQCIDRIMEDTDTRLVLISGRYTQELIPLLGFKRVPEIWGSHGWERLLPNGHHEIAQPNRLALQGLAEADTWGEEIMALGGQVEQKPACLAVHWRGLPPDAVGRVRGKVLENWALLAQESGLALHEFDGGLELRVPGRNKSDAVNTIFAEAGAGTIAAYLGDDLTDEDAFRAIKGRGLGVLVRSELRPTAADAWLKPPEELLDFLDRWIVVARN